MCASLKFVHSHIVLGSRIYSVMSQDRVKNWYKTFERRQIVLKVELPIKVHTEWSWVVVVV
jgi:hypothetical protein